MTRVTVNSARTVQRAQRRIHHEAEKGGEEMTRSTVNMASTVQRAQMVLVALVALRAESQLAEARAMGSLNTGVGMIKTTRASREYTERSLVCREGDDGRV